jgi:hypothetical protein
MMDLHRLISIGRPIDRAYATNRAIAGLTLVVAIGGFAVRRWTGSGPLAAFGWSLIGAAGFFLAWAVARELDPDHDLSAFAAAALSLPAAIVLGPPDVAAVVLVLLLLRVVNRTVGPAARPLDTLGILAFVGVAVWRGHLALAALSVAALLLDALLRPPHRLHLAAAGAALGLVGVGLGRVAADLVPLASIPLLVWLAMASTVPFLALIRGSGTPRSLPDTGGPPLSGLRVRAAQWLGLGAVLATVVVEGQAGLAALSPVWAALAATGVYFSIGAPTRLPHSVHDPS